MIGNKRPGKWQSRSVKGNQGSPATAAGEVSEIALESERGRKEEGCHSSPVACVILCRFGKRVPLLASSSSPPVDRQRTAADTEKEQRSESQAREGDRQTSPLASAHQTTVWIRKAWLRVDVSLHCTAHLLLGKRSGGWDRNVIRNRTATERERSPSFISGT